MAGDDKCPVCGSGVIDGDKRVDARRLIEYYPCPKCGEYVITMEARAALPGLLKKPGATALISHFIRRLPRTGKEQTPDDLPLVKTEFLETVIEHEKLPDPPEQVANMILWLGENASSGKYRQISPDLHQAVVGCAEPDGVWWVRDYLVDENLVKSKSVTEQRPDGGSAIGDGYTLSYKGWERYRDLQQKAVNSKVAFMAMDFRHPEELDPIFYDPLQAGRGADGVRSTAD